MVWALVHGPTTYLNVIWYSSILKLKALSICYEGNKPHSTTVQWIANESDTPWTHYLKMLAETTWWKSIKIFHTCIIYYESANNLLISNFLLGSRIARATHPSSISIWNMPFHRLKMARTNPLCWVVTRQDDNDEDH